MNKLPPLIIWAAAFAFVESAVVEYLRGLYYPLSEGGFRFPLKTFEYFTALGDEHYKRLLIELGREPATLIMLAALGMIAGRNRREAWAHFIIAFGVWDIFYYLWLKLFLDWPSSIFDWDLLFLIPVPWVGPVIAPVLISLVMIACGIVVLHFEHIQKPLSTTWPDWGILVFAGFVIIAAFCRDYENIMRGGLPNPFDWPLFLFGLIAGTLWFCWIVARNR